MSVRRPKRKSRLYELLNFDKLLLEAAAEKHARSLDGVIGVDEVGRGSLIGPVVAAALVFPIQPSAEMDDVLQDLDDSKATHFNHAKRVVLSQRLQEVCYWGIGEASQEEVETLNVAQASLLASYRAILHLGEQFTQCCLEQHLVVIDGRLKIKGCTLLQTAEIKADSRSAAVAGASVIAKAYRDALVIDHARHYPGYGWETNAGYPTPLHQEAIESLGLTPLHRKTYKAVQEAMARQQLLVSPGLE